MSKDIRIVPDSSGKVTFDLYDSQEDTNLALLQRLYVLLLSDLSSEYRGGSTDYSILQFMEGSNMATKEVLDAILAISCSNAVAALDDYDKENISSFSGTSDGENIELVLTLKDGTTISGVIDVD